MTLGKTGQKVTKLGMGTSWALSPSFVTAALAKGVRYIDTSETYENTKAEIVLGEVLERTKMRKDVYLVSKNAGYKNAKGDSALKNLRGPPRRQPRTSQDRLRRRLLHPRPRRRRTSTCCATQA